MAGTEPHTMLTGIILFFLCEISALSLAVMGGSILDIIEGYFYELGLFDVAGEWGAESSWFTYNSMVNIFYFTPYLLAGLGILILVLTVWHRHNSDKEEDVYDPNQYNL